MEKEKERERLREVGGRGEKGTVAELCYVASLRRGDGRIMTRREKCQNRVGYSYPLCGVRHLSVCVCVCVCVVLVRGRVGVEGHLVARLILSVRHQGFLRGVQHEPLVHLEREGKEKREGESVSFKEGAG